MSGRHLVVRVPPKGAADLSKDNFLNSFLAGLGADTFFREHYTRKCVAFVGGGAPRVERLVSILANGEVAALAKQTASETISCWLRVGGSHGPQLDTVRVADAASALTLHGAGASLYFRSSEEAAAAIIPTLARELGAGPFGFFSPSMTEAQGEIEVFCSKTGHTTDWHFDFQQNFTVQVSGSKRWKVKRSGITSPVRGATPHYKTSSALVEEQLKLHGLATPDFEFKPDASYFDDAEEVTLNAGDLFYFPAGCWHRVECTGDGVSVNMSMVGTTYADLGASAVRTALWREPAWREAISLRGDCGMGSASSSAGSTSVASHYPSLFPAVAYCREDGASARAASDMASVYCRMARMREVVRARLDAALRPELLIPPAAFLMNRLRAVEDEEEEEQEAEVQPKSRKRARPGNEPAQSKKRSARMAEVEEEASTLDRCAGEGIVVSVRDRNELTLDCTGREQLFAGDTALSKAVAIVWSPLACWTSCSAVAALGSKDEAEEEEGSEEEEEALETDEFATIAVHVSFGGPELVDSLCVRLILPKAELAIVRRLAALQGGSASGQSADTTRGESWAQWVAALKAGGKKGAVKGDTRSPEQRADALARSLLFSGAAFVAEW
jgi:hypothetical protein